MDFIVQQVGSVLQPGPVVVGVDGHLDMVHCIWDVLLALYEETERLLHCLRSLQDACMGLLYFLEHDLLHLLIRRREVSHPVSLRA